MTLHERLERIRSLPAPQNEESAKFQILAPILQELGWDPYGHEVLYEHSVGGGASGRVDIALNGGGRIVAMIEAKAPRSNLGSHVTQVLGYAFHEGVDICILTTGLEWWLYLPRESGDPAKRRFAVLKLMEDPLEQLSDDLTLFLGKENLISGHAVRRARLVLQASLETARLNKEIPGIWANMLSAPDDELVELVGKRVYENTNLRPAREQVIVALRNMPSSITSTQLIDGVKQPARKKDENPEKGRQQRRQAVKPTAISLWGKRIPVQSHKEILHKVVDALYERHHDSFGIVLELKGRKHSFAALDPRDLPYESYHQVMSSGYFVDTHFSGEGAKKRAETFLEKFGYESSDLSIHF